MKTGVENACADCPISKIDSARALYISLADSNAKHIELMPHPEREAEINYLTGYAASRFNLPQEYVDMLGRCLLRQLVDSPNCHEK